MADSNQVSDGSPPYSEDLLEYVVYNHKPLEGVIIDEIVPSKIGNPNYNIHQPREAVASLGNFNLPLEILLMVLLAMPFETLLAFMAVNSAAFNMVMTIPEFRILNSYGRDVILMLSRVHLESCFSIADVYEVFTSPSCSYCVSFGAYVFLPGLVRCCQNCAESDYRLIPISKSLARKQIDDGGFNLTLQMLANLPVMATLPGTYAENYSSYYKEIQLLSRPMAEAAMIKGILQNDPEAQLPEIPHRPAWHWNREAKVQRSMALAPMPYFDQDTASIQEGFRCRGCCKPFSQQHQCTSDCYIPNGLTNIRVSLQNRSGTDHVRGISPAAHVCVAKKLEQMEYSRRDFPQHYEQCDRARHFCKTFALLKPTWERDNMGSPFRMGPQKMFDEFQKCDASKKLRELIERKARERLSIRQVSQALASQALGHRL